MEGLKRAADVESAQKTPLETSPSAPLLSIFGSKGRLKQENVAILVLT